MRRLKEAVVLAIICALVIELTAAAFGWWQSGRIVYFRPAATPTKTPAVPVAGGYNFRLHPYFGFAGPYSARLPSAYYTNSLGFQQREPIAVPFSPEADDFGVGVFGGSVAEHLVLAPIGGLQLRDALQQTRSLAGKRVVVINLAQGSEKQPQQLIELSYLLALGQRFDLVVNVDGFNEFALGYGNFLYGMHFALPAGQIMGPLAETASPTEGFGEYQRATYRLWEAREALESYTDRQRAARSGIEYAYMTIMMHYYGGMAARLAGQLSSTGLRGPDWERHRYAVGIDIPPGPEENLFESIFELWLRSSDQMRALAQANGAAYVHVVQPNQYFSAHSFSPGERIVALNLPPNHPYVVGVMAGYQLVQDRKEILREHGIKSGIDIFDDLSVPVYSGNCCHYDKAGETAFAEFVAAIVSQVMK